ncbi:MAG: penicillin-binding transpeptidase domain-containing protein [Syntrophales bacterium]|jgi:cell division protein FtsI (penicillin-binding protein 3)|nr:penicillin-binding transpeptidase domain-containing protein [Syntrophales bacterium]MCK9528612.1 penicillin-binding transpeptidase domain-containing protein [Syntrophales bacterium]MDX9923053.1 penicillin-binding transpeptidase domain-containing protein [Syntrophales bacterium]
MTKKARKWLRFRVAVLMVLFLVLFVGLLSRALHLQIISGDDLKGLADRQHTRNLVVRQERKMILDRNGQKLAATIRVDSIYADPSKISDTENTAARLAGILEADRNKIRTLLSRRSSFVWIARRVSPDQKQRVQDLAIEGIYTIPEPQRFYPHRELACHIIGFAGLDSQGLEGLELQYDGALKSVPRRFLWSRDAKGTSIYRENGADTMMVNEDGGADLVLTIDSKIQNLVERELQEAVHQTDSASGMVIVMDVRTGEILAMANAPSYNLNTFGNYTADVRRNRAVTDTFEPGSIFKPFVIAAALEEGVLSEKDSIYCENGTYVIGGRTIHEAQLKKFGYLSAGEIVKFSSNIGTVKISEKLGKDTLHRYLASFGFGTRTGVDLPGEVGGIMRGSQEWRAVDFATISFGQGISVTGIQLAAAMSAIANNGVLMKPYIVKAMVDGDGTIVREFHPTPVRQVVSPLTARRMTAMMTDVVESDDGTGRAARVRSVAVAGKTGTSQKFDFSLRQYSSKQVITSFIGFFPAEEPRMMVLVVLDEPQKNRWGGVAAAPVFREISESILTRFNRDIDLKRLSALQVEREMSIVPASAVPVFNERVNSFNQPAHEQFFPDFTGLSLREVLQAGQDLGIDIRVTGSGWAVNQKEQMPSHSKGRPLCHVFFSDSIR